MRFRVEIDCGNAAFADNPQYEVALILQGLAHGMTEHMEAPGKVALRDANGNSVGFAEFTED
jgi:hypothetical protein